MIMWGPKRHSYRDPAHRFNKSCKKDNTFNKYVPKRQTFNTITNSYRDPVHRFHKTSLKFSSQKPITTTNIFAFWLPFYQDPSQQLISFIFPTIFFFFKKKKELTENCSHRLGYRSRSFWWVNVGSSQRRCLGLNGKVNAGVWGWILKSMPVFGGYCSRVSVWGAILLQLK